MSLLTIVRDVCDIVGIPRLSIVAAGTTPDARQMLALANREVQTLARRTDWQTLTTEWVFTATATEEQPGGISTTEPIAWVLPDTFFNRSSGRKVIGPLTATEWQSQKTSIGAGISDQFRFRGGILLLMPIPAAGAIYSYEYVTSHCVRTADDTATKAVFTDDTDRGRISERLIALGMVWRWKNAKGLDYSEDFRTYEVEVVELVGRDRPGRIISMSGGRPRPMLGDVRIVA